MQYRAQHKEINSSLKTILSITFPLLLSMISDYLMFVTDRVMLANYSHISMNAVTMASNFLCIFIFMFIGIANIAETFVGQFNGAKEYSKLASPVWQMIYFSLLTCVVTFPIAHFSQYFNFFPKYLESEGLAYQNIIIYFMCLPAIKASISAFFIGRGSTKIITISVFIGTLANILLNYILIYGFYAIPSLGTRGAAIATVLSEFIQIFILLAVFLNKYNRKNFNTLKNLHFNKKLFFDCIKIGMPISLSECCNMLAWYIVQILIVRISKDMAIVYSVAINIYVFFLFTAGAFNKASMAICANMIGRDDMTSVKKTYKIFMYLSFGSGIFLLFPLVFFPDSLLKLFNIDAGYYFYSDIINVLYITCINLVLETLTLSHWGILNSGGDTKYPTIVYQIGLWGIVIVPIAFLYKFNMLDNISIVFLLTTLFLIICLFFMYRRYKSFKWYNKLIMKY